jgi:hypothetical protein
LSLRDGFIPNPIELMNLWDSLGLTGSAAHATGAGRGFCSQLHLE